MRKEELSSITIVWKASDTSTIVYTLALVSNGRFSSIDGINGVFGRLIALLTVWLGSMHILSLPLGFSWSKMLESQSVGCDWFNNSYTSQSLLNSSLTLISSATGTRYLGACAGVTLGSMSICIGRPPKGFPRLGLKTLLCCNTSSFVSFPGSGSIWGLLGVVPSSTACVSSAQICKYSKACASRPLSSGDFSVGERLPQGRL